MNRYGQTYGVYENRLEGYKHRISINSRIKQEKMVIMCDNEFSSHAKIASLSKYPSFTTRQVLWIFSINISLLKMIF